MLRNVRLKECPFRPILHRFINTSQKVSSKGAVVACRALPDVITFFIINNNEAFGIGVAYCCRRRVSVHQNAMLKAVKLLQYKRTHANACAF